MTENLRKELYSLHAEEQVLQKLLKTRKDQLAGVEGDLPPVVTITLTQEEFDAAHAADILAHLKSGQGLGKGRG